MKNTKSEKTDWLLSAIQFHKRGTKRRDKIPQTSIKLHTKTKDIILIRVQFINIKIEYDTISFNISIYYVIIS